MGNMLPTTATTTTSWEAATPETNHHDNGGGGQGGSGPDPFPATEKTSLLVPGGQDVGRGIQHDSSSRGGLLAGKAAVVVAMSWLMAGALLTLAVDGLWSRRSPRDVVVSGTGGASGSPSPAAAATKKTTWLQLDEHTTPPQPELNPRYRRFQAIGLSLYTGGAPLYNADGSQNPECLHKQRLSKVGHLDEDEDDGHDNLYCYLGHANLTEDVRHRLAIMRSAVERAHSLSDPDPSTLKVFVAPEFFWRGQDGAYFFDEEGGDLSTESSCGEVCQVLSGLEALTANRTYQDWLFLMGTVVTAEKLPLNDTWDYLFLNFAPLYRGFDPDQTTHLGQRFLVPKRYVSNIDFLTPLRHYNATLAREIIDEQIQQQQENPQGRIKPKKDKRDAAKLSKTKLENGRTSSSSHGDDDGTSTSSPVFNPFLDRGRYSNHVWDSYKAELNQLEYTMIEYGWLVVDDIVMTVEVCLDHDMASALNSYTADAVTGRTTRIPKVDPFQSELSAVPIPSSMAQLSLVSSAGMTINKASIATTHNGYVFLQDGLGNKSPRMYYESECYAGLSFEGGTELVQRSALLTPNDVVLQHRIVSGNDGGVSVHPVYNPTSRHDDWKSQIRGVFSTAKYEPSLVVYPALDLPAYPFSQ
jgi:hypothetical protein